jgi:hypothetical protein
MSGHLVGIKYMNFEDKFDDNLIGKFIGLVGRLRGIFLHSHSYDMRN